MKVDERSTERSHAKPKSLEAQMKLNRVIQFFSIALCGTLLMTTNASADKLDDILSGGEIRCGIMLDVPPVGMRDNGQ